MKRVLFAAALLITASAAFALPGFAPVYLPAELSSIKAELGSQTLGDLKVSELIPLAERIDIARQKDRYVLMATGLSFVWPGAGQFASGDSTGGIVQTSLHLGITGGTLYWAHALLPADLRIGNLDYFGSTKDQVNNAWASHPMNDYWPAVGALAVGGAVDLALRAWSAADASTKVRRAIDDGTVTFEPRFFEDGHLGWGMRY